MAERHHTFREPAELEAEDGQEPKHPVGRPHRAAEDPEPDVATPHGSVYPPTLTQAFTTFCQALQGHLEDNEVLAQHCEEIQAWAANAGGDERHLNCILGWRHAIQMLEGVLGHSLTQP